MKFRHKRYIFRFFLVVAIAILFIFNFYWLPIEKARFISENTFNANNIEDAIDLYSEAQFFYQEPFVFEQKGLLLYQLGEYKSSYEQFIQAIELKNRFPLYEKIKFIFSFCNYELTDWNIKQILLYYTLGDISTKLQNYEQCVDDYSKMIEVASIHGREALEKEKRGFCYYKLGMYQEAYKDCIEEKEWLNKKINLLSDNKLKSAYVNRMKNIDELLLEISNAQGNN